MRDVEQTQTQDIVAGSAQGVPEALAIPSSDARETRQLAAIAAAVVLVLLMIVALFLPWASIGSSSQSLADYAAPQPAVVAWALLALGLSTAIVATVGQVFGSHAPPYALGAGGLVYLVGAGVWYVSSILPSVVASGCNSNGGPMCNSPATSPLVSSSSVGPGFVLALISSLLLIGALVVPRILRVSQSLDSDRAS